MSKKKQDRKKGKNKSNAANIVKGRLDVTRSGMGFVIVDQLEQDVLVRPNDFNTAMHGDTVMVRIKQPSRHNGRMQGEVTEVLERKQNIFMGRLEVSKTFAFFISDSDKPMPDIFIPLESVNGAKDGDRVVVKLVHWEQDGKRPQGEVLSVMDPENNNDAAMKEILLESGFPLEFDDEALEVAALEIKKAQLIFGNESIGVIVLSICKDDPEDRLGLASLFRA